MHQIFFFFNDTATTEIYTLSLHDALPLWPISTRPRPSASPTSPPTASPKSNRALGLFCRHIPQPVIPNGVARLFLALPLVQKGRPAQRGISPRSCSPARSPTP